MPRTSDPLTVRAPASYFGHGQLRHLLLLASILPGALFLYRTGHEHGRWAGESIGTWFALALLLPVLHQVLVVLVWRGQLCFSVMTRLFGDAALAVWGALFLPLLVVRPFLILAVGLADPRETWLPREFNLALALVCLGLAAWSLVSVARFFGIPRALGGDHFFERYRTMPMVRRWAFAYSSNAMYHFGFLGLWGAALLTHSPAALAAALFQHAYIWVHWYCTEQPDGVVLYGRSQDEDDGPAHRA